MVPIWDFKVDKYSGEPKDTSAAAVAICALLDAADMLEDSDANKNRYLNFAHKMMNALIDDYMAYDVEGANGILIGVTQSRTNKNVPDEQMTPYGDYFFLEALHRMLDADYENYW